MKIEKRTNFRISSNFILEIKFLILFNSFVLIEKTVSVIIWKMFNYIQLKKQYFQILNFEI